LNDIISAKVDTEISIFENNFDFSEMRKNKTAAASHNTTCCTRLGAAW
jgi:hypothetical protein